MPSSIDLKQFLGRINSLPAMPVIAQKMLALPLDTDDGETQLLKLIAQDPQISAKIIGLSNSALFSVPGMIASISDAAMHLGLTQVKSVAIGMATLSALTKLPEGKLKSTDLWMHSMAIAIAMRTIASHMPANLRPLNDKIFLAGLLHDIGYNALNFLDTNASNALYEKLNAAPTASLSEIEHELLGIDHGEIGAQLGQHWGLPEEIVAVIRYHHTPTKTHASVGQPLVNLVYIAEKMLPNFGITEHTAQQVSEQEWSELGISLSEINTIIEEMSAVAEQVSQLR
ncbi:MAG TPA: HDOD domain-containing protein [Nitrosomonas sp.]|nr:HDOD domain-containing protein [Nitrosomonas sp.]